MNKQENEFLTIAIKELAEKVLNQSLMNTKLISLVKELAIRVETLENLK